MESQIRYAKTPDGVSIAYCVSGSDSGYPVVICPFFVESFVCDDVLREIAEFLSVLTSAGLRIIRYNGRLTGLSDRDGTGPIDDHTLQLDLSAVVDACQLDRFVLWANAATGRVVMRHSRPNGAGAH